MFYYMNQCNRKLISTCNFNWNIKHDNYLSFGKQLTPTDMQLVFRIGGALNELCRFAFFITFSHPLELLRQRVCVCVCGLSFFSYSPIYIEIINQYYIRIHTWLKRTIHSMFSGCFFNIRFRRLTCSRLFSIIWFVFLSICIEWIWFGLSRFSSFSRCSLLPLNWWIILVFLSFPDSLGTHRWINSLFFTVAHRNWIYFYFSRDLILIGLLFSSTAYDWS